MGEPKHDRNMGGHGGVVACGGGGGEGLIGGPHVDPCHMSNMEGHGEGLHGARTLIGGAHVTCRNWEDMGRSGVWGPW